MAFKYTSLVFVLCLLTSNSALPPKLTAHGKPADDAVPVYAGALQLRQQEPRSFHTFIIASTAALKTYAGFVTAATAAVVTTTMFIKVVKDSFWRGDYDVIGNGIAVAKTWTWPSCSAQFCLENGAGVQSFGKVCSQEFCNCANGIPYLQRCSPGTVFNPRHLVCDWAYNVPGC